MTSSFIGLPSMRIPPRILVGDRVLYVPADGDAEDRPPGTVRTLQETGGRLVAFVEFDPPEDDDPGGAEADWIRVALLQRIEEY
jgi:hypothetical protein